MSSVPNRSISINSNVSDFTQKVEEMCMASRSSRKPGRPRQPALATAPANACRQLSTKEVRLERLALAADMAYLVLTEEQALPAPIQESLCVLYHGLLRLRDETRHLP